jgi:hypothetical protein
MTMRVIPMLLLSAALLTPAAQSMAQTLPGTPPAFTLTQDQLAALLAQCRAGNCTAGVQELIAAARAAGLSSQEFSTVVATIAATLVQATRNDPTLAAEVISALTVAATQTRGELSDTLEQIAALISSGNINDIDLNAVAQVLEPTETDTENEDEPTGGEIGSNA